GAHLAEAGWIDVIDVAGSLGLGTNQTRFAQHLEMLRDRRLRDRQFSRDFSDRAGTCTHQFEYLSSRRIAERGELRAISGHSYSPGAADACGVRHATAKSAYNQS